MSNNLHSKTQENSNNGLAPQGFFTSFKMGFLSYKPLIVIFIFCAVLSFVYGGADLDQTGNMMSGFMGFFLVFLSLFKFFDLKGFVKGFSTYDLVTKKFQAYGYAYPFIEFFLGVGYLSKMDPLLINGVTCFVMTVGGVGILRSMYLGQKHKCACMGTVLNVPLSTVSIFENFGMGFMAAYNVSKII